MTKCLLNIHADAAAQDVVALEPRPHCRPMATPAPTAYRGFGYHRGDLPVTEHIADTTVTLPLFPTTATRRPTGFPRARTST